MRAGRKTKLKIKPGVYSIKTSISCFWHHHDMKRVLPIAPLCIPSIIHDLVALILFSMFRRMSEEKLREERHELRVRPGEPAPAKDVGGKRQPQEVGLLRPRHPWGVHLHSTKVAWTHQVSPVTETCYIYSNESSNL